MSDLTIAIVGCGKQAPKHIAGLQRIPGVNIVLADVAPEAAAALGARMKLPVAASPDAVFADPSVGAVDICTPTPSHFPLIQQAVAAGKHFLCEKPLCQTVEQAQWIAEAVDRSGLIGMVGYIYRFAPAFELAHKLMQDVPATGRSEALGRIVTATFRLGGRGSHQLWKHRRDQGGGAISEMLVHMIDLAHWLFGAPASADVLACELLRPQREIAGRPAVADAEDYVVARLKSDQGAPILLQADLVTPAFTQWAEIQGENGTFVGSIQAETPSYLFCIAPAAGYPAGRTELSFPQLDLFVAQMAEFVRCCRTGTPPQRGTIRDSLRLMQTVDTLTKGL